MSVCVEYCLFCDAPNCGANWDDGGDADIPPVERRRAARDDGWARVLEPTSGKMIDLCPKCAALKRLAAGNSPQ